jgi:hypothetical protein
MQRYENIQTTRDDSGRRHYRSVLIQNIPYSSDDIWVMTGPGDRLDTLAYQFYGEVKYWWVIAAANKLGLGSVAIPPATQLRIPSNPYQKVLDFNNTNQ